MVTHSPILERVIKPDLGNLTPDAANQFLQFGFSEADRCRYLELSDKAQQGTLTVAERSELEDYLDVDDLLMMLQTKARVSLSVNSSAN